MFKILLLLVLGQVDLTTRILLHDNVGLFNFLDCEVANIVISVYAEDKSFGCQNRYYSW
jgi:hypothetical protein